MMAPRLFVSPKSEKPNFRYCAKRELLRCSFLQCGHTPCSTTDLRPTSPGSPGEYISCRSEPAAAKRDPDKRRIRMVIEIHVGQEREERRQLDCSGNQKGCSRTIGDRKRE